MITDAELKTTYPLISTNNGCCAVWKLRQYRDTRNIYISTTTSSKIDDDDCEVAYLKELEKFMNDTHNQEITKIKNKLDLIENSKKIDCNKIQNLPEDILYEIKSYLEPELKFTRKFCMLRQLVEEIKIGTLGWMDVNRWLVNVPKKLLMNLIKDCGIYPSDFILKSGDKKEEWCKFICYKFNNLFSKEKSAIRIDKLMEQHNNHILIKDNRELIVDKWFRVLLHISMFQKYRKELEGKLKKTDNKIKVLKNSNITIKKNI